MTAPNRLDGWAEMKEVRGTSADMRKSANILRSRVEKESRMFGRRCDSFDIPKRWEWLIVEEFDVSRDYWRYTAIAAHRNGVDVFKLPLEYFGNRLPIGLPEAREEEIRGRIVVERPDFEYEIKRIGRA